MELTRLQELRLMFAGEHDEDDYEISAPSYSPWLAELICRETRPESCVALRDLIYGNRPAHEIATDALVALREGYEAWGKSARRRWSP